MSFIGAVAEDIARGWVTKAVHGFVAKQGLIEKGELTAAQEAELIDGIMLEIQVGLAVYENSQKSAT